MSKPSSSSSINKIVFFTNRGYDPCAYLRLRGPAIGLGISVIDGKEGDQIYPERITQADLVVIQRDFPRDLPVYEKIIELAHQESKPVVFEIDDLLFNLPTTHPDRKNQHYTTSLLPMLQALQEADYVTVPTPALRDQLLQYNQNILVLPNFLDDALWKMREPRRKDENTPLIIGYMGSESHQPDVDTIVPVMINLLARYPEGIRFHFWGIKPPIQLARNSQVQWIPAQTYEYVDFASYFLSQDADIFIAPLVDHAFNRAKSPLKFFEYTALGAPGVYSRLDPFEQVITEGQDGLLASSLQEWEEKIIRLIEDQELRYRMACSAQETIRSKWLLSRNLNLWKDAFETIIGHSHRKPVDSSASEIVKSINHQYTFLLNIKDEEIQRNKQELALREQEITLKEQANQSLNFELAQIKVSKAWKIALGIRKLRILLIPPNTSRAKVASFIFHWLQGQKIRLARQKRNIPLGSLLDAQSVILHCNKVEPHEESVDIIVCVHNALEDVRRCLDSVKTHTNDPYTIIIVDDGSDEPTREYLNSFASEESRCTLIRNDQAKGYTLAANIGMRHATSPYLVLLNSDTIVGLEWVDRMIRAIKIDSKIGVVGPLSNTASWQSIPKLSDNGDWAINSLPANLPATEMSRLIAKYAACILPKVPLLNGFCMMIRKSLIEEIGMFDEENFGRGYGEEDDFNLRAGDAGWKKIIADDVYIFHAQSKSYSNERRYLLARQSGEVLQKKHGIDKIADSVAYMNPNRVMEGIRSRSRVMLEREDTLERGRQKFQGRKVLFVLPVIDAGGGANVIIDEARYMLQMGVAARVFNLAEYKAGFQQSYPKLDIPTVYGEVKDLPKIAAGYDAVIATANYSVEWLRPIQFTEAAPTLGYYIQGFEPLMYPEGSEPAKQALSTYTMLDECKRFTKTEWTRSMVLDHTGADSSVVGISVNIDLFRPRDMVYLGVKPVTIVAMVRPSSHYRNPIMTLNILKQVEKKYGKNVNIWLFGANDVQDVVDQKYLDFNWRQLGKLTQSQVATVLSKADIFTDFSSHQAMGLTALEAMSAGCSVIVPKNGGAIEFIHHRENGIVANTANEQVSLQALEELVEDDKLRSQLQLAGVADVVQYYPEKVSLKILETLFEAKM